jgi:hypothetical protein
MERPDVSHFVARLSNNSVGRTEREKFVRPLNFLEERAQAASPSMVPVFIFHSPPCTCVDDGMVGKRFLWG